MKAVLLSIQPKWVDKSAIGKKTIEVRKSRPKLKTPFKCYIYCTEKDYDKVFCVDKFMHKVFLDGNGKGKVIGEFVCDRIDDLRYVPAKYYLQPAGAWEEMICNNSCLSVDEIKEYAKGKAIYAWHITDLKIYDKPKELSEFRHHCKYEFDDDFKHCAGCDYYHFSNNPSSGREEYCGCDGLKRLKRPPQSWCYVEELGE